MDPKKILTEAIKATGHAAHIKAIWVMYPILEQMATKLAEYVGMQSITESGSPLLVYALKSGATKYDKIVNDGMNEDLAMNEFIKELLNAGTMAFNQQISVETSHGALLWQPYAGSLTAFLTANKTTEVTVTYKPAAIKKGIATAFVSMWLVPPDLLNTEQWSEIINSIEA